MSHQLWPSGAAPVTNNKSLVLVCEHFNPRTKDVADRSDLMKKCSTELWSRKVTEPRNAVNWG